MSVSWMLLWGLTASAPLCERATPLSINEAASLFAAPPPEWAGHLNHIAGQQQAKRDPGLLRDALEQLRAIHCAEHPAIDVEATRRGVEAVLEDERFTGARQRKDALSRFWDEAVEWFMGLLESDAMQRYAGISRVVYLLLVLLGGALVVGRALWQRRRRAPSPVDGPALERERIVRAESWREKAASALSAQDARDAFFYGQLSLLSRVTDVDEAQVRAADTHREVLAKVSAGRRAVLGPALEAYEVNVYAKAPKLDAARGFLRLVDEALVKIGEAGR